jgi:outer membrane lipoprotein SlyB
MRTSIKTIVLAPALVLAAACSKDKPADPSLNADLGLAAQANTARMDSISAAERTAAAAAAAPAPVAAAPAKATTTPRRTTTTHRASSGSTSGTRSAGTSTATAPAEPRTETVKNTKRDAVIGGAAGAILGAATSRDKVKGAVIGGAAGAILGGVIGNNVDVKKKPVP